MIDPRPTHLHVEPGDAKAACGSKDYPTVALKHAHRHVNGYGMPVCPDCLDALGLMVPIELREAMEA